jgi:hypothetical protein
MRVTWFSILDTNKAVRFPVRLEKATWVKSRKGSA